MNQPIQFFDITLKSGGAVEERAFIGENFLVQSCDAPFLVSFDGSTFVPVKSKTRIVIQPTFDRLWFKVIPGASANVNIGCWASTAGVFIEPGDLQNSQTIVQGFPAASIAGNANASFYGTGGSGTGKAGAGVTFRKAILVTNNDPGSDLEVWTIDGTTSRLATVFAKQAWYLETSDDLMIKNETGSAIACRVCQIFYVG